MAFFKNIGERVGNNKLKFFTLLLIIVVVVATPIWYFLKCVGNGANAGETLQLREETARLKGVIAQLEKEKAEAGSQPAVKEVKPSPTPTPSATPKQKPEKKPEDIEAAKLAQPSSTPLAPTASQTQSLAPVGTVRPGKVTYSNVVPTTLLNRADDAVLNVPVYDHHPKAHWDARMKMFIDDRVGKYFITPPRFMMWHRQLQMWHCPFEEFARSHPVDAVRVREQYKGRPVRYWNWQEIVQKYGQIAMPPYRQNMR